MKTYFKNDIELHPKAMSDCHFDKKNVGYVKNNLKKK